MLQVLLSSSSPPQDSCVCTTAARKAHLGLPLRHRKISPQMVRGSPTQRAEQVHDAILALHQALFPVSRRRPAKKKKEKKEHRSNCDRYREEVNPQFLSQPPSPEMESLPFLSLTLSLTETACMHAACTPGTCVLFAAGTTFLDRLGLLGPISSPVRSGIYSRSPAGVDLMAQGWYNSFRLHGSGVTARLLLLVA